MAAVFYEFKSVKEEHPCGREYKILVSEEDIPHDLTDAFWEVCGKCLATKKDNDQHPFRYTGHRLNSRGEEIYDPPPPSDAPPLPLVCQDVPTEIVPVKESYL